MLAVLLSVHIQHQSWLREYLYSKKDSIYFVSVSSGHLLLAFYYLCKSLKAFFFYLFRGVFVFLSYRKRWRLE